ncbi:MAG: ankyrin repeat domain-containing protein [Alphaproteobacteria bacterium]|nr:ankyrin repeat domain-containing protein [Alphaproteobacteria bacterium]
MPEITRKQKALLTAVRNKRLAQVRDMLRDKHLDPNFPLDAETTPLHEAVKAGHLTILKLLVAAGADVSRTTQDGATPQGLAEDIGAKDIIIDYLKSEGNKLLEPGYQLPQRKKSPASESFNQSGSKPVFTLQTLPEIFEPGKWAGKVEEMQKLWEGVPKRLKDKFDFEAALSEARLKTLKKNHAPSKTVIKKSAPKPKPPGV